MADGITTKVVTRVTTIINKMVETVRSNQPNGANIQDYSASVTEPYTIRFANAKHLEVACSVHVGNCADAVASLMLLLNFTMKLLEFCQRACLSTSPPGAMLQEQDAELNRIQVAVATWTQTKICD